MDSARSGAATVDDASALLSLLADTQRRHRAEQEALRQQLREVQQQLEVLRRAGGDGSGAAAEASAPAAVAPTPAGQAQGAGFLARRRRGLENLTTGLEAAAGNRGGFCGHERKLC